MRTTFKERWWCVAVLLIAAGLRLSQLGGKSLWVDEAFSVWNAGLSPAGFWWATYENHPPLYYLLLHAWLGFGRDEVLVRLPSAFVSLVGLALTYQLGQRLLPRRTAVLSSALLAVAPLDVWYAQEVRMVSWVIPAALLLALGLNRLRAQPGWGALWVAGGLALGLYLDYTIIPIWIGLSLIWLVRWAREGGSRPALLGWLGASLAGWLAFAPLWWHLWLVLGRYEEVFFVASLNQMLGGLAWVAMMGAAVLLLVIIALAARWVEPFLRSERGWWLALLVVVGYLLVTLLIPIPRLYSLKRLVVTGWPFVVLLVGWLVGRLEGLRWGSGRLAWSALLVVSLGASVVEVWFVEKDDWRGVVRHINEQTQAGDVIWMDPVSGYFPYEYYGAVVPVLAGRELLPEPAARGIWHVAERQPGRSRPASMAERWLDENWRLVTVVPFYRLEVRYYRPE